MDTSWYIHLTYNTSATAMFIEKNATCWISAGRLFPQLGHIGVDPNATTWESEILPENPHHLGMAHDSSFGLPNYSKNSWKLMLFSELLGMIRINGPGPKEQGHTGTKTAQISLCPSSKAESTANRPGFNMFQYVSIIIFPQLNDTGGKSCPCFPFKWLNVGPVMIHFPMNLPSGYLT